MRSLRTLMAAAWILGIAPGFAGAQTSPAPKDLLKFRPTQKGIEYDSPSDASAIAACKVETVMSGKKHVGYALRDGQGKLLRRFVDINGNGVLDQWSYYQDGFEVYRESDLNDDKSLDECRWMNAAGTRIATVSGTRITGWKRLSAEEASKVLVQALVWGDLPLLETVLATSEELSSLGLPKPVIEQTAAASARRVEQVKALQKDLKGWTGQTIWNRLDAMLPHLIPADAGAGQDVLLYENAVIFAGAPEAPINPKDVTFLQAPELVKVGESWKFVELPRAVDPSKAIVAAEGIVRAAIYGAQGAGGGPDSRNPALDEALRALAKFDAEHVNDVAKKDVAQFHVGRIPLLRAVIKVAPPEDQLGYTKQVADSLAAAYQTGFFPKGLELLDALSGEGSKIASYAVFRKISTEFAAANEEPGANPLQNQKKWMAGLKAFLDKYPKADEAPDALLQLASSFEFNAEEDEARKVLRAGRTRLPRDRSRPEGHRRPATARSGRQVAAADQGDRTEERDHRHREVPRQAPARDLLGHLGRPGQARPARADEGVPEAPRRGFRDPRHQPRQRPRRPRHVPQEDSAALAPGLRAGRPGEEPPGHRARHHRAADDDPGRPPGQGRQPQPPHRRRARAAAREAGRRQGRGRARGEVAGRHPSNLGGRQ